MLGLSGCHLSPSIDVFGAFFPAWVFSMAFGFAAVLVARAFLVSKKMTREISFLPVVYTALWILFSCAFWIMFFK